ncbi:LysR family transcriptional regulator [Saccharopolyspora indica]|uniref:LysR family transcriptional regulator n=1 Tax=Saccharopolyspora indica TaxID=1229659 RepID=UPI0022EB1D78|nr:LysR family transcriptional regulator [Saccharopolyspora indica]MDA3645810.1 LysR family transcriptional regulator [Saccharopolyspora indica]
MELRDIEVLLALAEELHFGRTAERLHLTQARVSQIVKAQERAIGAALFERTNRVVALTPLGEELIDDLRVVHRDLHQSLARAKRAARGRTDVLRFGTMSWTIPDLGSVFDAFGEHRPGCDVQVRYTGFGDPFGPLRTGEIDVAMLWLPVREPDLTVGPLLCTEPVVLATSAEHPLARRQSVSVEDLAGRTVIGGVRPAYWREAIIPATTPSGEPIPIGPHATTFEQMIPILATGEAISPVHASARRLQRTDIAFIPFHDAPLTRWALVWRTAAETDLIRAFAETVDEHGPISL